MRAVSLATGAVETILELDAEPLATLVHEGRLYVATARAPIIRAADWPA